VAQAFKALADRAAWEGTPRAAAAAWVEPIKVYKNAILQSRFLVDHLGFPMGKLVQWDSDWGECPVLSYATAGVLNPIGGRWCVKTNTSGTFISGLGANNVMIQIGTDTTITTLKPVITPTNDTVFAMQWDVWGGSGPPINLEFDCGFVDVQAPATGSFAGLGITGAVILRRGGDTNWQLYTKTNAGGAVFTDTGVAHATVNFRMRLEVIGSAASDNASAQVIAYINGAKVAQVAVAPFTTTNVYPMFRGSVGTGGSGVSPALVIGPVSFRGTQWAGDVAF
jgi:hypothetical protein